MINPRELRIGNTIRYNGKELTVAINTIQEIIQYRIKPPQTRMDKWEPIPLTFEWFERLGFFKYNNAFVLSDPTTLGYNDFEFNVFIEPDGEYKYNSAELCPVLHSVHQLQNLYFSLTGKELELKDKP